MSLFGRVDQALHVLDAIRVVAHLGEALDEARASGGVAPDGAQLVLGGDQGAEVAEELRP
jgi:hypothetical protein